MIRVPHAATCECLRCRCTRAVAEDRAGREHLVIPVCRRCSRRAETCLYFHPGGCIGVPQPAPMTNEEIGTLRGMERAWAREGVVR